MKSIIRKVFVTSLAFATIGSSVLTMESCSEPESNLVDFNHKVDVPTDTLHSVLGIIQTMRNVVDRTILLGEVRGDLISVTDAASDDLKNLAEFRNLDDNEYNKISDYYAVIQNCNFYLESANLNLKKHGEVVFAKEYSVIKSYRAWAYLQLALNYGSVPFFTKPILTEKDADVNAYPKYNVKQIAEYFIDDIKENVDVEYPSYGNMNGMSSRDFYINVRILLGDLCLWAERYKEAAQYYHDYLTKLGDTHPTGVAKTCWKDRNFEILNIQDNFYSAIREKEERITYVPFEVSKYYGMESELYYLFNSSERNNYYCSLDASQALKDLSKEQRSIVVDIDPVTQLPDTLIYEHINGYASRYDGDLRLYSIFVSGYTVSDNDQFSHYVTYNYKHRSTETVTLYRLQHIYLRYAEAMNRAGYPNAAFAVLKYGLWRDNIEDYIPEDEREAAGDLLSFSEYSFTRENTQGIHSRGCNRADADTLYRIPQCATKADSILAVENLICDEMGLETASEGLRYYDLMRLSMHRNDPTFLADKVARRDGKLNATLYDYLKDEKNWYLPIK